MGLPSTKLPVLVLANRINYNWQDLCTGIIGIYCIFNLLNQKIYIGSSINIYSRWVTHISDLKAGTHHSWKIQDDFIKYGCDQFVFLRLYECTEGSLAYLEKFFLDWFLKANKDSGYFDDRGYNIHRRTNLVRIYKMNSYVKEAISKTMKSIWSDDDFRKKMSAIHKTRKRKPMSDESKKRMSEAMKNSVKNKLHRERVAASRVGSKLSDEHRKKVSEGLKKRIAFDPSYLERAVETRTGMKYKKRTCNGIAE